MSANDIISRLGARFKNGTNGKDVPDALTRDIGGHFRNNQPYISGYFQVIFGLPGRLFSAAGTAEASRWLHSTCEGFTPHSQTLTKVDVMGMGGTGSSFYTNVMTTREFTCTFREMQHMPILNIIRQWTSLFDSLTGVSPLAGNEFIPSNYKGWAAVAQLKPTRGDGSEIAADDIEECYIYNGVMPYTIPVDTASATDITANDTVQLSATFGFDGAPLTSSEPGVTDKVVELLGGLKYMGNADSTFDQYSAMKDIGVSREVPVASVGSVSKS